jgi:hypothetical protein
MKSSCCFILVFIGAFCGVHASGKIFVFHHKPFWTYSSEMFIPLHCGAAISTMSLNLLRDDQGDHISEQNGLYAELTGLYWVWKNIPPCDFIGSFHYRRWLTPSARILDQKIESQFDRLMQEYDLLVPTHWNFQDSVFNQWVVACQLPADLLMMGVNGLCKKYPDYENLFIASLHDHIFYPCNLFVMKYELFNTYMQNLFDILFDIVAQYNAHQLQGCKYMGHLAERIFTFYLAMLKAQNKYKIKELPMLFIRGCVENSVNTAEEAS